MSEINRDFDGFVLIVLDMQKIYIKYFDQATNAKNQQDSN